MRSRRPLVPWSIALCLIARFSSAQLADVHPGSRLRVTSIDAPRPIDGTVIARTGDSVVVATLAGVQYRIALRSTRSLQIYRGRSRTLGAERGAFWGIVVVGAPLAIAYSSASPTRDGWTHRDQLAFSLYVLGAYAATGAVIGFFVRADDWERCRSATAPTCESRP